MVRQMRSQLRLQQVIIHIQLTAVADGVDVLSLSIGSPAADYVADTMAIGTAYAVRKGVVVVAAGGNDGPVAGSISNLAPWMLTVGASTMDIIFPADVVIGSKIITGQSLSNSTDQPHAMISGENANAAGQSAANSALCLPGSLDPAKVSGKIVVCTRGSNGRVAKGEVVKDAGGVGMVLCNDTASGNNVIVDAHIIPAAHCSYSQCIQIFSYIQSTGFDQIADGSDQDEGRSAGCEAVAGDGSLLIPWAKHHHPSDPQARRRRARRERDRRLQPGGLADGPAFRRPPSRLRGRVRHLHGVPARGGHRRPAQGQVPDMERPHDLLRHHDHRHHGSQRRQRDPGRDGQGRHALQLRLGPREPGQGPGPGPGVRHHDARLRQLHLLVEAHRHQRRAPGPAPGLPPAPAQQHTLDLARPRVPRLQLQPVQVQPGLQPPRGPQLSVHLGGLPAQLRRLRHREAQGQERGRRGGVVHRQHHAAGRGHGHCEPQHAELRRRGGETLQGEAPGLWRRRGCRLRVRRHRVVGLGLVLTLSPSINEMIHKLCVFAKKKE